jgi:NIPSNAP
MPTQLRIYSINRGALQEFAAEWKKTIKPLRLKLGFKIDGAWTAEATNQFVWIMRYVGPESWEALDRAYFQSPARQAMNPDPARLIARMEHYFIEPVSP